MITQVKLPEGDQKTVQVFTPTITELDTIVESLPSEEKTLFHRLFHFSTTKGSLSKFSNRGVGASTNSECQVVRRNWL